MTTIEAISFGTDRLELFGGKMEEFIKVSLDALKKQRLKGHWIPSHVPESILDECSECGFSCGAFTFNYCPNCGCCMVEPQESENKE